MDIPENVLETVREAAVKHLGDVGAAIPAAIAAVRALPDFGDAVEVLLNRAIQVLVYEARGSITAAVSRNATYTGPAKVSMCRSAAVQRVAESVYNHAIGGSRLGDLHGEDLDVIAESEDAVAAGHQFNAALCRWCRAQGVRDGQRVRDVIAETKLRKAYAKLRSRTTNTTVDTECLDARTLNTLTGEDENDIDALLFR